MAPDPEKKWKLILSYDTSNTARLDPEDRKYNQYQHEHDWIEKGSMKMFPDQIPNLRNCIFGNWKLYGSAVSVYNAVSIREYSCVMSL